MNLSESTADQSVNSAIPSLKRSIVIGGIGFCLASMCVFATVAFAERWMYRTLGFVAAYLVWTILFILLGGGVLSLLVVRMRLFKFYLIFALAFFGYAIGWTAAYFGTRGSKLGEWLGSLAGSVLMGVVFSLGFGVIRLAFALSALLFIANSLGYFLGSMLNDVVGGKTGMMLWGISYGLFLGAGLGAILHFAQAQKLHKQDNI